MEDYINAKLREARFYEQGTGNQYKMYIPFHNPERIKLGSNITFAPMCYLDVNSSCFQNSDRPYNLCIEDHVRIGPNNRIEAFHYILIKKAVLLGPNVYISDATHQYYDTERYIMGQGMNDKGIIMIDEGCFIGANAVINGNCTIGRGSIVGANTVLTNIDIPAYCVVSGNPPVLIKIFDFDTQVWLKVHNISKAKLEEMLLERTR